MVITNVESIKLRYTPPNAPRDGLAGIPARDVFLVRIETDEGLFGIGEGFALGSLESTEMLVRETLTPLLLGEDPAMIEMLWNRMYQQTFRYGRRGIMLAAISAVDIALWDLLGKRAGVPVYQLLGAAHRTLIPYASAGYYMDGKGPKQLAEEARTYQQAGFSVMKMKVGGATLREDMARIEAVREATGADFKLAIDANNAWNFNDALKMARFCEKMDIFFFEEPISSDFMADSVRLAQETDVPIAGYETELTRFGMKDFIVNHAVDIVQLDVIWTGGISECMKVGALASAWNKPVIPHFSASMVSLASNLHLGLALQNVTYFEYTLDENPLRDELSLHPIKMKDGVVTVPDLPGIGVELNPETVEKYRI